MRVYCPNKNIKSGLVTITDGEQIHHLMDVLRIRKGDALDIFDGRKEYSTRVLDIGKHKIVAGITSCREAIVGAARFQITLACAIPKKAKMDYIVQKCTELGVERIIPLVTERTIVKPDRTGGDLKLKRWRKIAMEAAQQSGRDSLPIIEPPMSFVQALSGIRSFDLSLIPNLGVGNRNIKDIISGFTGKSIIAFIGPEGDFSPREITMAADAGCLGVSLGGLVLKVDTAAIAIVSYLHLGR